MILTLSVVILLGALVLFLVRYARLPAWQAAVCVLFGFFLASSSLAPFIRDVTRAAAGFLAGLHL